MPHETARICPECGALLRTTDAYCSTCGHEVADSALAVAGGPSEARRRIGGTPWQPDTTRPSADPTSAAPTADPVNGHAPTTGSPVTIDGPSPATGAIAGPTRARRRRRRRKPFYRRKLVVIPLALVLLLVSVVGIIGYRAESTIATLHDLSTPPAVAMDNTENDDPLPTGVAIDSAPALAAVRQAEAAKRAESSAPNGAASPATPATTDEGEKEGGLLNRVKEVADNTSDLAEGAAVAAGVKDPKTTAITLLLMGVDARSNAPIDVGVRPDALAVVRLDPTAGTCRLLAIPRDTRVNLPGYGPGKINYALMVGGVPYQQLVVENLLGISVDAYSLIDFVAFKEVVDAVGGVTVNVPQDIDVHGTQLTKGRHEMDGEQALAFARFRGVDGDAGRIKRQWAVLRGLAELESKRDLVRDVNTLLPVVSSHLRSDLNVADMAAIAKAYGSRCTADSIQTTVLSGTIVRMEDAMLGQTSTYNVVDDATVRRLVAELLGISPS